MDRALACGARGYKFDSYLGGHKTGHSSVWLECLVWDQEVAGLNPVVPTTNLAGYLSWLEGSVHIR